MDVVVILCSSVLLWYFMLLSYMILVSSFLFIFLKVLLMFKTAWMCVNGNSWMDVDFFSAVFETNLHVNKTKIIFVFWVSCCLGFFTYHLTSSNQQKNKLAKTNHNNKYIKTERNYIHSDLLYFYYICCSVYNIRNDSISSEGKQRSYIVCVLISV